MSYQNIAPGFGLVMDLSTQEQELLCGGNHYCGYDRDCDHYPRRRRRGRINVIVNPRVYIGNRRSDEDYYGRDGDRDGDRDR